MNRNLLPIEEIVAHRMLSRDEPYPNYKGQTIHGFCLKFRTANATANVHIGHLLFGRIHKTYKKDYDCSFNYYYPGMLHNIRHKRMKNATIYMEDYPAGMLEQLQRFCIRVSITELEFLDSGLLTGEEYWKRHAKKKGIIVKWWDERNVKSWEDHYGENAEVRNKNDD